MRAKMNARMIFFFFISEDLAWLQLVTCYLRKWDRFLYLTSKGLAAIPVAAAEGTWPSSQKKKTWPFPCRMRKCFFFPCLTLLLLLLRFHFLDHTFVLYSSANTPSLPTIKDWRNECKIQLRFKGKREEGRKEREHDPKKRKKLVMGGIHSWFYFYLSH